MSILGELFLNIETSYTVDLSLRCTEALDKKVSWKHFPIILYVRQRKSERRDNDMRPFPSPLTLPSGFESAHRKWG